MPTSSILYFLHKSCACFLDVMQRSKVSGENHDLSTLSSVDGVLSKASISIFDFAVGTRAVLTLVDLNAYSIFPLFVYINEYVMATKELSRLDLRIPRKQKDYFEQALEIGGFRSLTDFIISAVSEKAEAIMEKHNNWLSSENDKKTFFNALVNPPAPNDKLKQAMKKHSEFKSKK